MNPSKKILYVEDDPLWAKLISRQLEEYGYAIVYVNSGEAALEILKSDEVIDLVLMDIDLGTGIDGIKLSELIQQQYNLPLLFFSSHTERAIVEKTENITNYGYVVKSSSLTVLDASIKMALKLFNAKENIKNQRNELDSSYEKMQATNEMLLQNQIQIKQSEEKYRNIYESNLMPISIFDRNTLKFLSVNQAFSDLYGFTQNDFSKMTILDIIPDDITELNRMKESLIQNYEGMANIGIFSHKKQNGQNIQVEILRSETNFEGKNAILIVAQNITSRMEVDQKLIEAKKRAEISNHLLRSFKVALDEHALVSIADPKGSITYVNEKFCDVSKYLASELIGNDHRIINSGYHDKSFFQNLWFTIKNKKVWRGDIQNKAKDGTFYWVNSTIIPILDLEGNVSQFISIRTEITEQKKYQLELSTQALRLQEEVAKRKEFQNNLQESYARLQESEERFRLLTQNVRDYAIIMLDIEGKVLIWNDGAQNLKGYKAEDVIGKSMSIFYAPEDIALGLPTQLIEKASKGERVENEGTLVRADGLEFYANVILTPVYTNENELIGLAMITRDITKERQSEQALRFINEELESILNTLPDLLFEFDLTGRYINFRTSKDNLLALSPDLFLDKLVSDVLPLPAAKIVLSCLKEANEKGFSTGAEMELVVNGEIKWFELSVAKKKSRNAIDHPLFVMLSRDVTDKKIIQIALIENESKLNSILDNIEDTILSFDKFGLIKYVNSSVKNTFGYEQFELMNHNILLLKGDVEDEEKEFFLYENLKLEISQFTGLSREVKAFNKNGETFPVDLSITRSKYLNEPYFTAVIKDLTSRKSIEAHLRQSQKLESLGQISGGIAHDFNNILAILLGNLELISRKIPDKDHSLKSKIDASLRAVGRGTSITKKLLAFARKQIVSLERVDLNASVLDMKDLIYQVIGKQIELNLELHEQPLYINVDVSELENVILNLAINARDAMSNSGSLTIRTSFTKDIYLFNDEKKNVSEGSEFAELAIIDNGKGIPFHLQEKVFEPFFTTKQKDKGTGLGLSLTYGFVKQSGGFIHLYSEPEKGTCFKLYFPLREKLEKYSDKDEITDVEILPEVASKFNILIVDDEPSILQICSTFISELGFKIKTALNVDLAIQILESRSKVDLVITDILMPGKLNGIDLARLIRERYPEIKILLSSGFPGHLHEGDVLEIQQYSFIEKPFQFDSLKKKIKELLLD
ncbi:PAS domain S-box protein [Leptospira congkakensis]|uniref:histidine kinase n=1 Tax=Leptospira congkakensis TaxID=2484932 RepID=A0A4Z1A5P2_9LEPT|nr:PAS domain S-box protein [Leptospira congkakensis]TGL86211.1 PAS domain S-box protein [Leptospira congkakensis]TGL94245.1 PAS domain S-box protein [Leptospira congkakensis]TGL94345.1 PAS domain S-box protein [Leptospira congkakensis]